ncbi:cyclin-SDS isoform X1 [Ricinus communis]|uniref:cyclin-SDS isoform X1 n=1 Tax=Ricinus communis TaxID=3988 RepID=UPI00201A3217|nr:cyclin-SDS isoform X1 [Ricinus communis]
MEPEAHITKKPRSKRCWRFRHKISPSNSVSCNSSRVTVESNAKKRKSLELESNVPFRRITRSYYKQQNETKKGNELAEVSDSSCVESNSGVIDSAVFVRKVSDDIFSTASKASQNKSIVETELSEISKNEAVSVNESLVEQKSKSLESETDLACAEHFSLDDVVSDYSSSHGTAFSELQFEVFPESSSDGREFSDDYTPSIFLDSGSEFSEKSSDDAPPSRTYSLLLEFRCQFLRSSVSPDTIRSLIGAESHSFMRLKNEDDEESYQLLRGRERRQLFLHDYVELYRSTTEYGDLILQQRLQMVHWIVEQSTAMEFQHETLFLGVSLLDRFFSKGYFSNVRNLQIVGIACLTLATRIEENQLCNRVKRRNFHIESNVYSRSEVVAMEWLVQEVLDFQCYLPTIHNFMWFYLKAARADAAIEKRARYLARLALSDHEHLRHWPSTVAAGLVIMASLQSEQIESYQRVIEVHIRTKENDLHECIKTMEWLIQYVS